MKKTIDKAVARIKSAHEISKNMGKSLIVAYSGGKDSDVLLDLAIRSGVPFQVEHNHTTVDTPHTVYHIRDVFATLETSGISTKINKADITMWDLIVKECTPPTRIMRYCCRHLKEKYFEGRHIMTGIRWCESTTRKSRGLHETLQKNKEKRVVYFDENDDDRKLTDVCRLHNRIATNPIIDWTDTEVWEYIRDNKLKINPLYSMGYRRVGCVGCPMSGKSVFKEFRDFPKYKDAYVKAFDKMLENRKARGLSVNEQWKDGESVFNWWTNPKYDVNQLTLECQSEIT
jgi:phosphoadenosine phosphosulfate reductase